MEFLKNLGLTEREVKVYLSLLELGSTTTGPIIAKTKLQSAKVYETLNKLKEKGLVSFTIISRTKYFQASDPKELMNIWNEQKRKLEEIMPTLQNKQQQSRSKQIVVIHDGYQAYKALFNRLQDELKKGDFYWAFAFKNEYYDSSASFFLKHFHELLKEKKIDDKLLGHVSVKKAIRQNFKDNSNLKMKFTPNETPLGVIIIKGKVINLIWGKRPTAIEISSEQIYEQYKNFFLELWKKSKK
jgi:sugar-specific transcriptional regulator TrmB